MTQGPAQHSELMDLPVLVTEVEATLKRFFEQREPEIARIGEPAALAVDFLKDLVFSGGKRIRPAYALAGFYAAGGEIGDGDNALDAKAVLQMVSALELIQACALAHDDVIDASDTRRGQPTVHRAAEHHHANHHWLGDAAHFGESVAILAGDLALVWADDMFLTAKVPMDKIVAAIEPWRAMRTEVIGGQLLDIFLESEGSESLQLAENVNRFKSAAYTIERPLHIGAAIAQGSPELIKELREYGRDIGIAFQLRDDLLGVFGDPEVTGKPAGDDLREGKRTVLVTRAIELALEQGRNDWAAQIREQVGTIEDPEDIAQLASLIRQTGAVEEVERRIEQLTDAGIANLERVRALGVSDEAMDMLYRLTQLATSRKS
ncbi:polyprenyl synthetase family protein [Corynebacterium pelargi]|uniref:(2E,6E)-farnesyl diphosphate synthase n=1 Tax=Corynebacterium pelargi TaxID=1471400 RepID=A0A410W7T9_9CORY|nr:(2E,6E)-farnesyl diphosphate synthase [Corynebacterium pelargi]GGG70722.1 geranylgeranyl pyrophosphate synthase [Corynebacterium pelargi]